jgi:TRAP-type C4-dicarboxylate transport system permease small subunit
VSVRGARRIVVAYLIAAVIVLSWPGAQHFNSVTPRILGLPFSIFFVAAVALSGSLVMLLQERAVSRVEDEKAEEETWNAGN